MKTEVLEIDGEDYEVCNIGSNGLTSALSLNFSGIVCQKCGDVNCVYWIIPGYLLHRTDGPALLYIKKDGIKTLSCWYVNGKSVTPEEVFDLLSEEERNKAIWKLDRWK